MSSHDFKKKQAVLEAALKDVPFVPVFQLTTHKGKNTLMQDAERKVAAMLNGGIDKFEFLLRGDETMPLQDYVDQTLGAITELAKKYPKAKFGVGTVSSEEIMQQVASHPDVSFAVTAHWPDPSMIHKATDRGKPIFATISDSEKLTYSAGGNIVGPGKEGIDTLVPAHIPELRSMGVETFKVFEFGAVARKRFNEYFIPKMRLIAGEQKPGDKQESLGREPNSEELIAAGLIAIAEAIHNAYDPKIPNGAHFYAMATGGITADNLGLLAAGLKNQNVKKHFMDFAGGERQAAPLVEIINHTTVVAGGTFITKDYDKVFNNESATEAEKTAAGPALEKLSRDVSAIIKDAKLGIVRPGPTRQTAAG